MTSTDKFYIIALVGVALLSFALGIALAYAQDAPHPQLPTNIPPPAFGYMLICDTKEQIEYAASVFDDFDDDAPHEAAVNKHLDPDNKNPPCAYAHVAYYRGEPFKVLGTTKGNFLLVPVLVVGIGSAPNAIRHVEPLRQFTMQRETPQTPGRDI